jgi:transcription initiation factor TFIIB
LELPETTLEHAAYLFRKAIRAGHLQGLSIEAVAAACVCAAGKKFGPQLTFNWVADVSPVEKSRITTAYRKLVTTFDLPIEPATPKGILPRVADRVGVPGSIRRHARQVLQAVEDANEHIGQSPPGLAAAALYYAAKETACVLTQEEVAAAAGVSEATLSRQWRRIQDFQD